MRATLPTNPSPLPPLRSTARQELREKGPAGAPDGAAVCQPAAVAAASPVVYPTAEPEATMGGNTQTSGAAALDQRVDGRAGTSQEEGGGGGGATPSAPAMVVISKAGGGDASAASPAAAGGTVALSGGHASAGSAASPQDGASGGRAADDPQKSKRTVCQVCSA